MSCFLGEPTDNSQTVGMEQERGPCFIGVGSVYRCIWVCIGIGRPLKDSNILWKKENADPKSIGWGSLSFNPKRPLPSSTVVSNCPVYRLSRDERAWRCCASSRLASHSKDQAWNEPSRAGQQSREELDLNISAFDIGTPCPTVHVWTLNYY